MNEANNFALVPKTPAAIEKAEPGAKRVLSGMVADTLALVKKQQRSKPRIVLVNDCPEPIQLLELLINDWFPGATILTFQSGEQAWQELLREDPDLLITDMRRENDPMDGWTMVPLLAEKKVKYPIVVVTAYAGYDNNDRVRKPFQDLLRNARRALNITAVPIPFINEDLLNVLKVCLESKNVRQPTFGLDVIPLDPKEQTRRTRPLKIVVVEDEPLVLQMLERIIREKFENITLLLFDDPVAAWRELSETDPDLLITNFVMPGLSGGELLKRLAKKQARYPVILTSGYFRSTSMQVQECMNLGMKVTFLEKPFTQSSFLELIEDGLGIKRASER
jgi:DNA-binding NtrC family response regulator